MKVTQAGLLEAEGSLAGPLLTVARQAGPLAALKFEVVLEVEGVPSEEADVHSMPVLERLISLVRQEDLHQEGAYRAYEVHLGLGLEEAVVAFQRVRNYSVEAVLGEAEEDENRQH